MHVFGTCLAMTVSYWMAQTSPEVMEGVDILCYRESCGCSHNLDSAIPLLDCPGCWSFPNRYFRNHDLGGIL